MYCGRCGKKIADDALFCPGCGADLSAMRAQSTDARGATGPGTGPAAATPEAGAPEQADGRLAEQISRTRRRSRRRIPMVLVVILVILAIAGTALAATYVYRTFIAPAQQGQPADEEAAPEEPAEEEDEAADEERAQRAVYDDVLTQYRDAQAQGWAGASGSDLPDLAALGTMASVPQDTWMGEYYYVDLSTTLEYAYTDLGGDGTLDLVVAARSDAGGHVVLGLFSTDGTQVTSLMNGDINGRSYWHVLEDGRVMSEGSDGASDQSINVYQVQGGALVPDESATMRGGGFNAWSADPGADLSDPQAIWQELRDIPDAQLDWQPLEDFSPEAE